jgi:hypothetical protein
MHKRIGILGGLTPESTITYYQHIVHRYEELHGDHGYPEVVIYSVTFQRFEDWMEAEEWDRVFEGLLDALRRLAAAGADFVVMTNTMHLLSRASGGLAHPDAEHRRCDRAGHPAAGLHTVTCSAPGSRWKNPSTPRDWRSTGFSRSCRTKKTAN